MPKPGGIVSLWNPPSALFDYDNVKHIEYLHVNKQQMTLGMQHAAAGRTSQLKSRSTGAAPQSSP
jgi:hypothetical protein